MNIQKSADATQWCDASTLPAYELDTADFPALGLVTTRKLTNLKTEFKTSNVLVIVDCKQYDAPLCIFQPKYAFWKEDNFLVRGTIRYKRQGYNVRQVTKRNEGDAVLSITQVFDDRLHIYVKETGPVVWSLPVQENISRQLRPRKAVKHTTEPGDAACVAEDNSGSEQVYGKQIASGQVLDDDDVMDDDGDDDDDNCNDLLEGTKHKSARKGAKRQKMEGEPNTGAMQLARGHKPRGAQDGAIHRAHAMLQLLETGVMEPDVKQTSSPEPGRNGQRMATMMAAGFKNLMIEACELKRKLDELLRPRLKSRRRVYEVVEDMTSPDWLCILLHTDPYISKTEFGQAFLAAAAVCCGKIKCTVEEFLADDNPVIERFKAFKESVPKGEWDAIEATLRKVCDNYRSNWKNKVEKAVRDTAKAQYNLKSANNPNGFEPNGEVVWTMLQDDTYRDQGQKRLAAPEFQACALAWYKAARRIPSKVSISLELAEFTLQEIACIDLQVRRTLQDIVPSVTSGNNVGHALVIFHDWESRMAILRRWGATQMALNILPKKSVLGRWDKQPFQLTSGQLEMARLAIE